jgi:hypothetical protein
MTLGDTFENDTFRVLEPLSGRKKKNQRGDDDGSDSASASDSDDDNPNKKRKENDKDLDDEVMKKLLRPSSKPFTRHFNVLKAFTHMSETQMAPLNGPDPIDPMRHAYEPIPQRMGLKRRWMPFGVKKPIPARSTDIDDTSSSVKRRRHDDAQPASKRQKTPVDSDGPHQTGDDHMDDADASNSKENGTQLLTSEERKKASKDKRKAEKKASKKEKKSSKKSKKKGEGK